jgi:hypothetical protein
MLFLALLPACVLLAALVAERYPLRVDLSERGIHSLSPTAAQALATIGTDLEMVAFLPDRPIERANLERRLAPYLADASHPQLRYIDPEADPESARDNAVMRTGELHLRLGERQEVVFPVRRQAIDAALNRLALKGERWILNLTGHGEARIDDAPDGLGRLAGHLDALGYRLLSFDPRQLQQIPDNAAMLLIAAPTEPYPEAVERMLGTYLARGGRLLWLLGDDMPGLLSERLGLRQLPGIVVDAAAARYGLERPDNAVVGDWPPVLLPQSRDAHAVLHRASALAADPVPPWRLVATLRSSALSWNETGLVSGRLNRDPDRSEQQGPLVVGAGFETEEPGPAAKVVVLGSAQLLGNTRLGVAGNLELTLGLVRWLTDNAALASETTPVDLDIRWTQSTAAWLAIGLMTGLPLAYLLAGLWLRRRRRAT